MSESDFRNAWDLTLFRHWGCFRFWLWFLDFVFFSLPPFSFHLFPCAIIKHVAMNSVSTLSNIPVYLRLSPYLGDIRWVFLRCKSQTGFGSEAAWFINLMDIVDSSFTKLYHFPFLNQRTRTHFPSSVQACTLAGVSVHFLFTPGSLEGRRW